MGRRLRLNRLAAAVAALAALSGGKAATLNPAQTGEYLIFPYYTTNGGFVSHIRITNATDDYKIVKLRFRESSHSEDIFDILIYLTPRDQFHGITEKVGQDFYFRSNDTTCTYPLNPTWYNGGHPFNPAAAPWKWKTGARDVPVTAEDASEGYAEVIEVATIRRGTPIFVDTDGDGLGDTSLLALLTHAAASADIDDDGNAESTGVPNGGGLIQGNRGPCAALLDAWSRGVAPGLGLPVSLANWSSAAYSQSPPAIPYPKGKPLLLPPEGGLWGYMAYIHVNDVVALVSDPETIENYSNLVQHYATDDLQYFHLPNLASGGIQTALFTDPDTDTGATVTWESIADDDSVNPLENSNAPYPMDRDGVAEHPTQTADSSLEAMASQMLAAGIMNDFFLDPDAGMAGATNWVVTFPAALFGAWDADLEADPLGKVTAGRDPQKINLNREIDERLGPKTLGNRKICVEYTLSLWDREEQSPLLFEPSPVVPDLLCREVNVIQFAQAGGIHATLFDSPHKVQLVVNSRLNLSMDHGWGMLLFRLPSVWTDSGNCTDVDRDGDRECFAEWGYPVTGFSAMTAAVGNARLGETVPHKKIRLYVYDANGDGTIADTNGNGIPDEGAPEAVGGDPDVLDGIIRNRTL